MAGGGAGRNVVAIAAYNAFRGLAVGGFMTLFPMYMKSLGYEMDSVGGVISLASVSLALLLPWVGYAIDSRGPRPVVVATGILIVAAPLLAAASEGLAGLALAYTVFLLSFLAGQPARMSLLAASLEPSRLGTAVGVTSSVFSASRTAGPAVAGLAAASLGFGEAFTLLSASAAVGLALFAALSVPVESRAARRPRSPLEAYRGLVRPPRGMGAVLAYVSLDRFAWSLWFPMLSAHLYASGYGEAEVGYAITGAGVVQTLLMPLAGRLSDRAGAWLSLAASEALGVAAALALAEPHPPARLALGAAALGASIALWVPGYNTLIARVSGGTGAAYASANTYRSLAGAPAPYAGGYAYEALSPQAPMAVSAALLAAAAAYAVAVLSRVEKPGPRKTRPGAPQAARGPAPRPLPPEYRR